MIDDDKVTLSAGDWVHYFRNKETLVSLSETARFEITLDGTEISVQIPEDLIDGTDVESVWRRVR